MVILMLSYYLCRSTFTLFRSRITMKRLAENILREIDITDSPFLALALTLDCSIWSNDGHFKHQDQVGVYTTKELTNTIDM